MPTTRLWSELAAFPKGRRIAIISDSFGGPNVARQESFPQAYSSTTGVVAMLQALSFGQFLVDADDVHAVSGETTAEMRARYGDDIAATYGRFDILWIDGGRNDGHTSLASGEETVANIVAMATAARDAGKLVLVFTPNPPRSYAISSDDHRRVRGYVNREVKKWCATQASVAYIDVWRDWVDPADATGGPASGITTDGLHPDVTGAIYAARRTLEQIGASYSRPPREQSAWDWYDPTTNPKGNLLALRSTSVPRMAGTDGSVSTYSGTVASGFTAERIAGTGDEIAFSKEAAVAGYDSPGSEAQVITVSTLDGATNGVLRTDIGSAPDDTTKGSFIFGQFEVELAGMSGCTGLFALMQYWDGAANVGSYGLNNGSGGVIPWPDGTYLIRTPSLLIGEAAQNLQLMLGFVFESGGSGVIKARSPGIWIR